MMNKKITPDSIVFKLLEFYGTRLKHRGQWKIHKYFRERFNVNLDVELEVTRDNLRWMLNPSDFVQSEFFWLGTKDYWDVYHIKKLLAPSATLLDIGANFGYYSLVLSEYLGRQCDVYSFEPFPASHERLVKNIAMNSLEKCITPFRLAIGDARDELCMREKIGNTGGNYVDDDCAKGIKVVVDTLDQFVHEHGIDRIDFIKVDVEGLELKFIEGAKHTLGKYKPNMLIEINPPCLERAGASATEVVDRLQDMGYDLLVPKRKELHRLTHIPDGQNYVNVLCVHSEHNS